MDHDKNSAATLVFVEKKEKFLSNFFTRFVVLVMPVVVQRLSRPLLKLICSFFLRWEVEGVDNLKKIKGNVIFAPNHVHEMDSFMVGAALPWFTKNIPIYYVSKPKGYRASENKFFAAVYGSWIFPPMGAIAIDAGQRDYSKSLWRHVELLNYNKNLCIFPEGRIVRPGEESQARGGIGYLVDETRVPVVPVRILGIDNLKVSDFLLRRRKLRIVFGRPLLPEDLVLKEGLTRDHFYRQVSRRIVDEIYRLEYA